MRVAFVTYNSVGDIKLRGYVKSGWYHQDNRSALMLETNNPMGLEEALMGLFILPDPITARTVPVDDKEKRPDTVDQVWTQLRTALNTLDHIILYIGIRINAAEKVIELAREIPAEKVTFVMCDWDVPCKQEMIASAGLQGAKTVVVTACGGKRKMSELFQAFLATGALPG